MEIPIYLAMTAAELRSCPNPPSHTAWLSCLFSPYGRGLSNLPQSLPENSLLILSDRTPPQAHDPQLIYETLKKAIAEFSCRGLLLDFERPENQESAEIARALTALPCPVGVSASYAVGLDCAVFVPPPPPNIALLEILSKWKDREIWLEISSQAQVITATENGTNSTHGNINTELKLQDPDLFCHYSVELSNSTAIFTLRRTKQDWENLLTRYSAHITHAIGLYQEFL